MPERTQCAEPESDPNNLKWFNVALAARYALCSQTYIRQLIHGGELKAVRLGQTYRIDRVDLDQFLTRRKRFVAPYRKGTHPWVAKRHAQERKHRRAA